MTMSASCPFCSYEVVPARGRSGALVCPLCRNTGKTERPDAASFRRALGTFETRILDQLARVQVLLAEAVAPADTANLRDVAARLARLEAAVQRRHGAAGPTTADTRVSPPTTEHALEERLLHLEGRLDDIESRMETATTATAIRLDATPDRAAMDAMLHAVEALQHDIRALHDAYDREAVPELRQQVRVLARSVRDLQARQDPRVRSNGAGAEWQRPAPWTLEEADEPFAAAGEEDIEDETVAPELREPEREVPLVTAGGVRPPAGRVGPGDDDFSGVPPVMDDGPSMRDLVARDAIRMPANDTGDASDPLERIDTALHDIEDRLRHLRDR